MAAQTICIIGGGLGGLGLAHAILRECPSNKVVVLERDASEFSRSQGIIIGVQQPGIDSLCRLGGPLVVAELEKLLQYEGPDDVLILDRAEKTLMRGREWLQVSLQGKPRSALVDRAVLRTMLATTLPPGVISWDSRVSNLETDAEGVWVECENGQRIRADLVIGADGYRSNVRAMRCPRLIPEDLGVWQAAGLLDCPETKGECKLYSHARKALVRMNGTKGLSLLMFITTAPSVPNTPPATPRCLWSISLPSAYADETGLIRATGAELRDKLAELVSSHFNSPAAVETIRNSPLENWLDGYMMNSVKLELFKATTSPVNAGLSDGSWRVMLMGDALHKTTTQAGLGATAAFQDGVFILEMLRQGRLSESRVEECNNKMWKNAGYVVKMSVGNTKMLHSVPGPVVGFLIPILMRVASAVFCVTFHLRKGCKRLARCFTRSPPPEREPLLDKSK